MKKRILQIVDISRDRAYSYYRKTTTFVDKRPFMSFLGLLGLFVLLIILGNFIRKPKTVQKQVVALTKYVRVYRIGEAPKVRLQAQIEKSGVVQINSLTSGVVQSINFEPGQTATKGQTLVNLSTNYQGGNALSLQRQVAQTQYNNLNDTYQPQKDLINRQRDLANAQNTNAADLRSITSKSLDETRGLIALNNDILSTLDQNITNLTNSNVGTSNNAAILSTKQLKSQFQSANNSLNAQLRSSDYSASNTTAPAQLSDIQKDIALKQLAIQEKALDLNREVSRLQVQIARVNEGLMFPAAPFTATVQRVFVKVGQAVQPGTPLMIISQGPQDDPIIAIAYAPNSIARNVSFLEPSRLYIDTFTFDEFPFYVTADAIQGTLYGIYFNVPENYYRYVTEKGYIDIDVPVGYADSGSSIPFIPLDAVYQSQSESYVFVIQKGKVVSRKVTLGAVYGSTVIVESGIGAGDQIILDRTVTTGESVKAQ